MDKFTGELNDPNMEQIAGECMWRIMHKADDEWRVFEVPSMKMCIEILEERVPVVQQMPLVPECFGDGDCTCYHGEHLQDIESEGGDGADPFPSLLQFTF